MLKYLTIKDKKIGRWTVTGEPFKKFNSIYYLCICECGHEKEVSASNLTGGFSKMCKLCSYQSRKKKSVKVRFLSKIKKTKGCWLWTGFRTPTGYGQLGINKRPTLAHRISWTIFKGEIPNGMYVCHRCDVRFCVNPHHLFLGTAKDNTQDAFRKGRLVNPPIQRKLSDGDVLAIRSSDEKSIVLAEKFNVSIDQIKRIKNYTSWSKLR
jgi:hypothetical protein